MSENVDTLKRVIYAFDLGANGSLSSRRVFAHVADSDGYPDGPVVDAAQLGDLHRLADPPVGTGAGEAVA